MSRATWKVVCKPEETNHLDAKDFCVPTASTRSSPIDSFYVYTRALIPLGVRESLSSDEHLGRLLLLGLVSGTEDFFRSLLAGLIEVCPLTFDRASDLQLSLGATRYYGDERIGLGVLEGVTFSTSGEIAKWSKRIAGVTWSEKDSLHQAVDQFEAVCHLRHACVHSRGELSRGNARALGVDADRAAVRVDFGEFHTAVKIAYSLVRAYSRHVFPRVVQSWLGAGLLTTNWATDREKFTPLFELFRSRSDGVGPSTAYHAHMALRPAIRAATSN